MGGMSDLCPMETLMSVPSFATLPAQARVWVYKSATAFTPEQVAALRERGQSFTGAWVSHGEPVKAAFEVLHNHFVVIAADLRSMVICGGAIDSSVKLVSELEREMGLRLTDRMVVLYEQAGVIHACRLPEIEGLLQSGAIGAATMVFDDQVSTLAELSDHFRAPLERTWMARYL